jgi:hypothetical protein
VLLQTVRVIVAIEPLIYREALAFSLEELCPWAEVAVLSPTDDLAGEVGRTGAHLVVANRVPPAAKEAAFRVEVTAGERLDAEIGANGYSRSVRDVRVEHVLAALDEAAEKLVPERIARGA